MRGIFREGLRWAARHLVGTLLAQLMLPLLGAALGGWAGGVAGAAIAFGLLFVVVFVYGLIRVPVLQRNDLRKRTGTEYKIVSVPEQSTTLEGWETGRHIDTGVPEKGELVRLVVRNDGRSGRFSVRVESVDGMHRAIVHPSQSLHWTTQPQEPTQEIRRGETRAIGIGYLLEPLPTEPGHLRFVLQGPSGSRYTQEYKIEPGVRATVSFIVSLVDESDVDFIQPFAVMIEWGGPGERPRVSPVQPDPVPRFMSEARS